MLRFLSRFLGFWLVAAAVVMGVVDGAKSIAASSIVTTSLAEIWAMIGGLGGNEAPVLGAPWPADVPLQWILASPAVVVIGAVGAFFMLLGAKRRPPSLSREFAA
jgi:hypothetical protein